MKIINKKFYQTFILVSLLFFLLIIPGNATAGENKDMILVLDTSLSMAGYGGKNIFGRVKQSLAKFIDQLDEGDSFTFMSFETDVKTYPQVFVKDESAKDVIKKYLSMIEAAGKWTYTEEMVVNVFKKVQEMEKKDKKRQRVVIILTDGIDDPPPGMRHKRFNVKDIATAKDVFIYIVNLGALKNDPKMAKMQKQLKEGVSKYTKVVEAGGSIEKVIGKDLMKDVDKAIVSKKQAERGFQFGVFLFVILIILIIIAVLYLLKRISSLKVKGSLDYWDHTLMDPGSRNYNMTKQSLKKITIGKGSKYNLNIRDITTSQPIIISAKSDKGTVYTLVESGKGQVIEFMNKARNEKIADGDIFKAANYSFRYKKE